MFAFNLIVTRELSLSDIDNGNNLVCLLVETFQNSPRLFVGKRQLFLLNNVTTTSLPFLPGSEDPVNSRCILNSWPSGLEWKLQNHQLFSCLLTVHAYHVLQERSHNKQKCLSQKYNIYPWVYYWKSLEGSKVSSSTCRIERCSSVYSRTEICVSWKGSRPELVT